VTNIIKDKISNWPFLIGTRGFKSYVYEKLLNDVSAKEKTIIIKQSQSMKSIVEIIAEFYNQKKLIKLLKDQLGVHQSLK